MTSESFPYSNLTDDEKAKEQEQFIQKQYDKGIIQDYSKNVVNGNGKAKNQNNPVIKLITEKEIEKNKILNEITRLRQENPNLSFEQWSDILKVKRQILIDKIIEHFPKNRI